MDHKGSGCGCRGSRKKSKSKYVSEELWREEMCKAYEEHYFDARGWRDERVATAAFVDGHVIYLRERAAKNVIFPRDWNSSLLIPIIWSGGA